MVLLQLIKRPPDQYTWKTLNLNNSEVLEIQTWKGTYSIPNPNPHPSHTPYLCGMFPIWAMAKCNLQDIESCAMCRGLGEMFLLHHPLKQAWVMDYHTANIQHDLLAWILSQPPKFDQLRAAYEQDRESVEKEFTEIEKSVL